MLIAILIGIGLRFIQLDHKFYWFDEAYTSLRVSGFTEAEVVQRLSQTPTISLADLLATYQYPNAEKNAIATIQSLALEEPQHPPFYFLLLRFWLQHAPHSIMAIRGLSALFSVLVLPGMYWLCRELSVSPIATWLAVSIVAVSPFQVLYAQEARQYSLWAFLIVVSYAALLRSLRTDKVWNWGLYTTSLTLGLYTFPATLGLLLAQAAYVLAIAGRRSQQAIAFLRAATVGLLAFSPWLVIILTSLPQINQTFVRTEKLSIGELLEGWIMMVYRQFFDFSDYRREIKYHGLEHLWIHAPQLVLVVLILILVACALWSLWHHSCNSVRGLFFTGIAIPFLPIAIWNVIFSGFQSIVPRYLIPCGLLIQLSVALFLANSLVDGFLPPRRRLLWHWVAIALLAGGIASCWVSSQANFWWTKSRSDMNYQTAPVINASLRPLVISDAPTGRMLAFSHLLNDQVQLQLQPECFSCSVKSRPQVVAKDLTQVAPGFTDVFLYNPSPGLVDRFLQQGNELRSVYQDPVHPEQRILRVSRFNLSRSNLRAGQTNHIGQSRQTLPLLQYSAPPLSSTQFLLSATDPPQSRYPKRHPQKRSGPQKSLD
jgi:uncharacterized membrane protein